MKRKIIFLMLMFGVSLSNVEAMSLEINGQTIDLVSDLHGEGYNYDYANNVLELNNYHGGHIKKEGDLNLIIRGYNVISDTQNLIQATNITIDGNGTLEFNGDNSGIVGTNILINNIMINGSLKSNWTTFTNQLALSNVEMNISGNGVVFQGGNTINVLNSRIILDSLWGFRYNRLGVASFENSNLEFSCRLECFDTMGMANFINTNMLLHSDVAVTNNSNFTFDKVKTLISSDGKEYVESSDYNGVSYLKTVADNQNDNGNSQEDNDQDSNDNDQDNDQSGNGNSQEDSEQGDKDDSNVNDDNSQDNVSEDNLGNGEKNDNVPNYTGGEYNSIVNPKTYDDIYWWLLLLIVSLLGFIGLILIIVRNKRRGKNQIISFK